MDQQASIAFAEKYVEDLLSFFGINVSISVTVNEDVIEIDVPSNETNSLLIGRNAETLRAIQYLTSTTLRNKDAALTRVNIDIAGYKQQRAQKITEQAKIWIEQVRSTGDSYVARLNAADRRIVHNVATDYDDIQTFSEGEGRDRRVIIAQATS